MSSLLQQIKSALDTSTKGNWDESAVGIASNYAAIIYAPDTNGEHVDIAETSRNEDAKFICLAKNSMPALLKAAQFVEDFWSAHEPNYVSAMADDADRTDLDELADKARAIIKEFNAETVGSTEPVTKHVVVTWQGEDGNNGYIHGIEHIQNDEVLHVEWFLSLAMRDLAYQKYLQDSEALINEAWHHIGNGLTRVFNDEMNGCSWFMMDGHLMFSPGHVQGFGIYTEEIGQPEYLPDWHRSFIVNMLIDTDYQNHYGDGVFVDVLTDWLKIDKEYVLEFKKTGTGVNSDVTLTERGFVFQGIEITNPTLSPCGRFQVDPKKAYGFYVYHTGGGCTALQLDTKDGGYIWLTDMDLSHELPTTAGKPFMMGFYDKEGEEIAIFNLKTAVAPE
jgi:hypothetical protein